MKIKKLEELKKQEELQKVLEVAAAKLSETKQTQITEQQQQLQQKLAQTPQPVININNKSVLTENQIKAKSILLSKHNLLKTTNEDKFLTNILEKYTSIKNKFDSEAKVTKTSMESSSSSSSSYTTETALVRSNSFKRSLDPTFNRNKILDIYLIKSQLRIGDTFKFAEKIFNNEQQLTSSNPRNKSSSENILPIPMTTSNLVENLNTNRNLYVANSKPLLIKRNLEMTSNMIMTSTESNAMPLSFSKINMEKIKMIEKKNNELLIKDGENFKLC